MTSRDELTPAVEIACEAGEVVKSYFGSDRLDAAEKGVRDVVTAADFASERLISRRLREAFPNDGIMGEEGANVESSNGRCWYIDPLDGTLNFSRGLPIWCVSLALYQRDQPLVAVIVDPLRDEAFTAATGQGARRNGEPITCSRVKVPSGAVVHLTVDFNDPTWREGLDDLKAVVPRVLRTRNIGAVALALAYLAAGRLDVVLHRFASSWDYAAGALLVHEAGGVVTDLSGSRYSPETRAICAAATPSLHEQILPLITASEATSLE